MTPTVWARVWLCCGDVAVEVEGEGGAARRNPSPKPARRVQARPQPVQHAGAAHREANTGNVFSCGTPWSEKHMANLHKSKATPLLPGRLVLVISGHGAGCLRGLGPAPDNPERAENRWARTPAETAPRTWLATWPREHKLLFGCWAPVQRQARPGSANSVRGGSCSPTIVRLAGGWGPLNPGGLEVAKLGRCWPAPMQVNAVPQAHRMNCSPPQGWSRTGSYWSEETRSWQKSMLFPRVLQLLVSQRQGQVVSAASEVTKQIAVLAIKITLVMDNAGKGEAFSLRISQLGSCWYWI